MTKFFTSLPLFLYFVYLNISIINYTQSLSLIKKKFSIPKPTQNFSNSKKKKIEKKSNIQTFDKILFSIHDKSSNISPVHGNTSRRTNRGNTSRTRLSSR